MPIPSASSKIFWPRSIFFEHEQIFLTMVKSYILPYIFTYLSMVKNIWPHSKNIERGQIFFWTSRWNRHKYQKASIYEYEEKYGHPNEVHTRRKVQKNIQINETNMLQRWHWRCLTCASSSYKLCPEKNASLPTRPLCSKGQLQCHALQTNALSFCKSKSYFDQNQNILVWSKL